ncbi:hypothetical protein RCZ15_02780 [Capnocytophaga catalasegens]|uniref:DUF7832 domain-containing protein n=2 Tax=Capnocytophaga catalasegens TaxID=1004260 RepID=A0AAV5APN4_9FLAO|nr:hypothetical protein RCZ03_09240 [Capnocytophaga catalasegens]GJM49303.1 hypothetical protein RCZ15_02780 [Capnocytophaga catalasegens]GJM52454.1 hypothetical protein RCZ16_07710 [Capnocytophaga catalasegens]
MDGVLTDEELNTKGKAFAKAYYTSDKTKFAKSNGYYLDDYDNWVEAKYGADYFGNAYFYIENTEENYKEVKDFIEKQYGEFLASKAK